MGLTKPYLRSSPPCVGAATHSSSYLPVRVQRTNLAQVFNPLRADLFVVLSNVHSCKWYSVQQYLLPRISDRDLLIECEDVIRFTQGQARAWCEYY